MTLSVGVLLVGVMGCGMAGGPAGGQSSKSVENHSGLPAGWRWEGYRGVKVGVPNTWGYGGSSGQLADQWCVGGEDRPRSEVGVVARPGPQTLVGCLAPPAAKGVDPGTLVANGGTFVGFDAPYRAKPGTVDEGDRTTVSLHDVTVVVQAPDGLRSQIVRTIRPFTTAPNGCSISHLISGDPSIRPQPRVPVDALTQVTRVTACRYGVAFRGEPAGRLLLSSVRLTGQAAQDAVEHIVAAPTGGGPDSPTTCLRRESYGGELIVLLISSAEGRSEVFLRYSGCDHNGFDDGHRYRRLTQQAVAPFVTGPNMVLEVSGLGKGDIFDPR